MLDVPGEVSSCCTSKERNVGGSVFVFQLHPLAGRHYTPSIDYKASNSKLTYSAILKLSAKNRPDVRVPKRRVGTVISSVLASFARSLLISKNVLPTVAYSTPK